MNNNYKNRKSSGNFRDNAHDGSRIFSVKSEKIPENYVDVAENCVRGIAKKITTSKLRNMFSLFTGIYDEEKGRKEDTLKEGSLDKIQMARIRIVYEMGRESSVREFVEKTKLLPYIKGIENDRKAFIRFFHYIESVVAYHSYWSADEGGTKDVREDHN